MLAPSTAGLGPPLVLAQRPVPQPCSLQRQHRDKTCNRQQRTCQLSMALRSRSRCWVQPTVCAAAKAAGPAAKSAEEKKADTVTVEDVEGKKVEKHDLDPKHATSETPAPALMANGQRKTVMDSTDLEGDAVLEKELSDNGFRSTRRTKLICTIGPASCSNEMLASLAANGMNVARLNMCHGSHDWHRDVIRRIRQLNRSKGYSVAIMVDTEGSEVHTHELGKPIKAEVGAEYTFTIRDPSTLDGIAFKVSYDAFVDDVQVGDQIVVDGGMVRLEVVSKAGPDVGTRVVDPGIILSRANLTFQRNSQIVRARNAMLPVLSSKDWLDIDFALSEGVDFIAVSFVKTADVMNNLKSYVGARSSSPVEVIAKIESFDSVPNVQEIVEASDGVMVARGDLGAQIPLEEVPSVQKEVVMRCRQMGKPVIVASHLLQSMIEYPTPTRAEVADIADVVRQRADALMLSGESAVGAYPEKALGVLRQVSTRIEEWCRQEKYGEIVLPQIAQQMDGRVSEELCASAVAMANALDASAIFVYTRRGYMANFLSRCRPDAPIFAFTDSQEVRQRLNLRWGVMPFRLDFQDDPEANVSRTFSLLKARDLAQPGDLVIVVSDIRPENQDVVRSAQIRRVPSD